jgi:hypothetical protein
MSTRRHLPWAALLVVCANQACDSRSLPARDDPPARLERARLQARLGLRAPPPGAWPALTECDVFELGARAPAYLGRIDEGNVAPYGILLAARPEARVADYLLASALTDEWEYSRGYGGTAADTAMVLEGLLAAHADRSRLRASLEHLRQNYFDAASGGFNTVKAGRAEYWHGPSVETSALIGYLMQQVDAQAFAPEVAAVTRYLKAAQRADGGFEGRWFPSALMATYHAARFLRGAGKAQRPALARSAQYVVGLQRPSGSIGGSIIDTALALLVWDVCGERGPAAAAARSWLTRALEHRDRPAEPVLYYWLDAPGGTRVFFSCVDRGELAAAWAKRALDTAP